MIYKKYMDQYMNYKFHPLNSTHLYITSIYQNPNIFHMKFHNLDIMYLEYKIYHLYSQYNLLMRCIFSMELDTLCITHYVNSSCLYKKYNLDFLLLYIHCKEKRRVDIIQSYLDSIYQIHKLCIMISLSSSYKGISILNMTILPSSIHLCKICISFDLSKSNMGLSIECTVWSLSNNFQICMLCIRWALNNFHMEFDMANIMYLPNSNHLSKAYTLINLNM